MAAPDDGGVGPVGQDGHLGGGVAPGPAEGGDELRRGVTHGSPIVIGCPGIVARAVRDAGASNLLVPDDHPGAGPGLPPP
ncbi:hypothetical protein Shyhy02_15640 [Streptomyces hygroscopicus subsp. hygroscopicus]|nr:hypothetical protein Shyhy02_15640 [Streptomyces hygroscopicus subsp. hygroscopicus]